MQRFPLEKPNILFSLRATAASLVALGIAFALGFDSAYWAPLTVWVVTQSSRGMTASKGFYRFVGTCVGALFAVGLIYFCAPHPWLFVLLLSAFVALSTVAANLVPYFRSYGCMLAGVTAALVGLSVYSHPERVAGVASERILCIFLGIAVSFSFAIFLSQSSAKQELFSSIDQVYAAILEWIGEVFLRKPLPQLIESERQLITRIGQLEELTTYAAAESMQVRRQRRKLHGVIASLFGLLSAARGMGLHLRKHPDLVAQSEELRITAATAFQSTAREFKAESLQSLEDRLERIFALGANDGFVRRVLGDRLSNLRNQLAALFDQYEVIHRKGQVGSTRSLSFHRDMKHAWIVGLRSFLSVFGVGAIWLLTEWRMGPLMMIMSAVNCGVFATSSNPKSGLVTTFRASLLSAVAGLLCLQLFMLGPHQVWFLFLLIAVCLIPGGLLVSQPSTTLAGVLYGANFLVFAGPSYPLPVFDFAHFMALAGGFFAALVLNFVFLSFVLPTDPKKRSRAMIEDLLRDLERMARAQTHRRAFEWETLMYNRVGRLIQVLGDAGEIQQATLEGSFAVLDMGQEIIRLQELFKNSQDVLFKKMLQRALACLGESTLEPLTTASQLRMLAQEAHSAGHISLEQNFYDLADQLSTHEKFIRRTH